MPTARFFKLLPIPLLLAATAAAQGVQNADASILVGPAPARSASVNGTTITGSVGVSAMFTFGYQLHANKTADLYLDVPFAWKFAGSGTVTSSSVTGLTDNRFYATPGVRLKFNVHPRLSLFLVGGAGYGGDENYTSQIANGAVTVTAVHVSRFAGELGAGLDFRLTKLLSLRVEDREFITSDRATSVFGVGLALHF